MLRGGAPRPSAKPRRRHPRQPSPPSPPTPSRRARAAAPESKESSALEAPVVSSVEETSFTFEFKRGFKRAKKASLPPMDAPIGEEHIGEGLSNKQNVVPTKNPMAREGPKQVEFTHCSPGIVARLMGLDTVPRPKKVIDRCQSDIHANRQRHLSGGVEDPARASSGQQPCNVTADELPALKDVFEVTEMENMLMHDVLRSGNEKPHLAGNEADIEFVRQKFLDAKRLSSDEAQRNSKEYSEALEILYSKKDVFLEILQENRAAVSGFSGPILSNSGLQCSHRTGNAAAAQSFEQEILCRAESVCDGPFDVTKESEKPIPSMLLKETSAAPLEPMVPNRGKSKGSGHRSQIVVLKPHIRRKNFTPVLSSQEGSPYDRRNATQYLKSPHDSKYKQALMYSEPRNEDFEQGDITKQKVRKQTPKSGSRRRPSEEEYNLAEDSERAKVASTRHDDTIPICSSTGSSVSRKARKQLSERWKMARQIGSENSVPKDIKTLGEILELSDRDGGKGTFHKRSNYVIGNVRELPASPLGISSKDGWKTGIYCKDNLIGDSSRNFLRSKSLPASYTSSTELPRAKQSAPTRKLPILKDILNTPADESGNAHAKKRSPIRNAKQKNGRTVVHVGKENTLPEKEIHVTSEKERHSICVSDLSRASNVCAVYPDGVISIGDQQTSDFAVHNDDKQNSKGHTEQTLQKLSASLSETKDVSIINQDIVSFKEERNPSLETDIAEFDPQPTQPAQVEGAESCECSSPAASSQQGSDEESSYSGIFKSINVGIQELRVQLKMLKMEDQDDTCGDYSDTLSGDECNTANIITYQTTEEQLPIFRDVEDRDFSYVHDMFVRACDFPEYTEDWQVSPDVFIGLENKYNKLLLWSKSDRKLLFDLVNSILADMTAPGSSFHSKIMQKCLPEMDCGQLAANVWQMVQKQSNCELFVWDNVQPLPLDHHSELELIKMEIVKMIHDDIIEDSVIELM
ncbi:hypothetical protein ACP70R_032143 [Stipagrostis hirtigluma subsp. patula]